MIGCIIWISTHLKLGNFNKSFINGPSPSSQHEWDSHGIQLPEINWGQCQIVNFCVLGIPDGLFASHVLINLVWTRWEEQTDTLEVNVLALTIALLHFILHGLVNRWREGWHFCWKINDQVVKKPKKARKNPNTLAVFPTWKLTTGKVFIKWHFCSTATLPLGLWSLSILSLTNPYSEEIRRSGFLSP